MFPAGRMVLRLFHWVAWHAGSCFSAAYDALCDSDIPMNVPFTFSNKQPLPRSYLQEVGGGGASRIQLRASAYKAVKALIPRKMETPMVG